jgi:hypothetical protein
MPDNDKEKNKNQKTDEKPSKDTVPEIELADFQQYVQLDIPYSGKVKNLGKIKYDPNALIILRKSDSEEPTKKDMDWISDSLNFGGTLFGGFSTLYDYKSFQQWNLGGWTDAKGNYQSARRLLKDINTDKYDKGVQGIRNSYSIAQKKAIRLSRASVITRSISNVAGGISIAISCSDMFKSRVESDDKKSRGAFYDICFGCLAFVSGVGFVISGVYFITDTIVEEKTGKRIHEHWTTWIGDRVYPIQRGIEAFFYRILNNAMPF